MKTCFGTVIYKQARPYFDDLINSLKNQTDKEFDLMLVNDNYNTDELKEMGILTDGDQKSSLIPDLKGQVILIDLQQAGVTIPETRIAMLTAARVLGYDLLISGDADDKVSTDRVEAYKAAYQLDKTAAFFYNKLITENGETVFKSLPESVRDARNIAQCNFIGLSTSGIAIQKLSFDFLESLEEGKTPVFDWYLFTRILMDVGGGRLVNEASTIYRIYQDNLVGIVRDINKEYQTKKTHYSLLAPRYDYFKNLLTKLEAIQCDSIQPNINHQGYWWSDIRVEE